jgi:hypothetical protein
VDHSQRNVIEAQEFRLIDLNGKLRALITSSSTWKGEPSITLYDDQGYNRLVLEMQDQRPRVTFYSPGGQPVAGFGVDEKSGTRLVLSREDGTLGFFVEVPADGDAVRQEFDSQGQPLKS